MNETGPAEPAGSIDVLVCTFNSARHLEDCLRSARAMLPVRRLIVVDRNSTDGTQAIARRWGAEVHSEEVGLGYSRRRAIELSSTPFVLFLDSDVVVRRSDFAAHALAAMEDPSTAAVVGCAEGHRFLYGLPLSLTLFRREWVFGVEIPSSVQGRETYYIQRRVRQDRLRVRYLTDAYLHYGTYRSLRHWPEFQGAWVRITGGLSVRELLYSGIVVLLIQMNSRRARNLAYAPIFYAKLLRGFFRPERWRNLDRTELSS
ncbi:MAG: glycosyltransferase family 2 protein [Thermoplasmata archaeon]|nr:glycosyltransferase family 2 protein [Thermoplasmata archaeon]